MIPSPTPCRNRSTRPPRAGGGLRHDGPCGERVACPSPSCRATFPGLRTVEVLMLSRPPSREWDLLSYCCRRRIRAGEMPAQLANYVASQVDWSERP